MANQEWDRFGEEIKRTVQEAVESRNFDQLSRTISRTINDAVNSVTWNAKIQQYILRTKMGQL